MLSLSRRMIYAGLATLAPILTASCQSIPSTKTTDPVIEAPGLKPGESSLPFCLAAEPIRYKSKTDRPELVKQLKAHNAVGFELKCRKWLDHG